MKQGGKRNWIALAILAALCLGSLPFLVHSWFDLTNDGSMYVAAARSIAAGDGYSTLGIPFSIRPPGFAVALAPIIATLGTDFFAFNLFVSLWGVGGVLLLFLYQRARLGTLVAFLVAVAVWANPGYQRFCTQVMSDVPGTTLFLGCLLLDRWASRRPSTKREVVLGLAIGLSAYFRSVTILLVPAICVSRILRRVLGDDEQLSWVQFLLRRILPVAFLAWAVLQPWNIRNSVTAPEPPADQTFLYSYSTGMWHTDGGDPSSPLRSTEEILDRIPVRSGQVAGVLGSRLRTRITDPTSTTVCVLLLLGTLYVLVKRRAPAEFFVFGTLVVLVTYFGFDDRLLLPLWVIVFPNAAETIQDGLRRFAGTRAAPLGTAAALAAFIAFDCEPRRGWEEIEAQHDVYVEMAEAIEARLEPDARVASAVGWHYSVFLDRPVWSLHFAVRRAERADAVEAIIKKYDIDTVVLSPRVPADRALLPYFQNRYPEQFAEGPPFVVRVR